MKKNGGADQQEELLAAVRTVAVLLALPHVKGKASLALKLRRAALAAEALNLYMERRSHDELGNAILYWAVASLDARCLSHDASEAAIEAADRMLRKRRRNEPD
jgi:hypothetical protein